MIEIAAIHIPLELRFLIGNTEATAAAMQNNNFQL